MKAFILPLGIIAVSLIVAIPVSARTPLEPMACTMQYQPVCGAKEVQCVRAPCYPQYQTYGNSCMLAAEGATFVHDGECTASETGPVIPQDTYTPPAHCQAWFDGCNHCARGPNGEAACTLMACEDEPKEGYCTKFDTPSTGSTPTPKPEPAPEAPAGTKPVEEQDVAPAGFTAKVEGFFASLWSQMTSLFSWF